jgi:hypothetical protein
MSMTKNRELTGNLEAVSSFKFQKQAAGPLRVATEESCSPKLQQEQIPRVLLASWKKRSLATDCSG